jgi:hypothetical protein
MIHALLISFQFPKEEFNPEIDVLGTWRNLA